VVTAVFSTDGAYQGISFAIPAYTALDIAKDLIRTGKVVRGYLGVEMHKLTEMEADFFGFGETNGMLITGIHPNSPAQQAGIEPGDVLLRINGKNLQTVAEGRDAVARTKPGSKITISLFRKGRVFEVEATLSDRNELADKY
jgi:S1-C subfamily serine protease